MKKVLISTGGSGGHVLPSLSLYDHLKNNFEVYLTTDKRGSSFIDKKYYNYDLINVPNIYSKLILFPINIFLFFFCILVIIFIMIVFLFLSFIIIRKIDEEIEQRDKIILLGCTTLILLQAFIHIGVNIRVLPTTGMTLPFLSYGGSSIISTAILSGIILNITKRKIKY